MHDQNAEGAFEFARGLERRRWEVKSGEDDVDLSPIVDMIRLVDLRKTLDSWRDVDLVDRSVSLIPYYLGWFGIFFLPNNYFIFG